MDKEQARELERVFVHLLTLLSDLREELPCPYGLCEELGEELRKNKMFRRAYDKALQEAVAKGRKAVKGS